MELFVASDRPIELSHGWKGERFLTIQAVQETEVGLGYLTLPYVRFLGAHTGCSCGFKYGHSEGGTDEAAQEERDGHQSVAALRDFLETQLQEGASLELLSRWYMEAGVEPAERAVVPPDYFGGDTFDLPEGALLQIRRAVEQRDAADGRQ